MSSDRSGASGLFSIFQSNVLGSKPAPGNGSLQSFAPSSTNPFTSVHTSEPTKVKDTPTIRDSGESKAPSTAATSSDPGPPVPSFTFRETMLVVKDKLRDYLGFNGVQGFSSLFPATSCLLCCLDTICPEPRRSIQQLFDHVRDAGALPRHSRGCALPGSGLGARRSSSNAEQVAIQRYETLRRLATYEHVGQMHTPDLLLSESSPPPPPSSFSSDDVGLSADSTQAEIDQQHITLLRNLGVQAFGTSFGERKTHITRKWKYLGFQQNDPLSDFRKRGSYLCLQSMLYFVSSHPYVFKLFCMSNKPASRKSRKSVDVDSADLTYYCPFALVCISVTDLLISCFSLDYPPTLALSAKQYKALVGLLTLLARDMYALEEVFAVCVLYVWERFKPRVELTSDEGSSGSVASAMSEKKESQQGSAVNKSVNANGGGDSSGESPPSVTLPGQYQTVGDWPRATYFDFPKVLKTLRRILDKVFALEIPPSSPKAFYDRFWSVAPAVMDEEF